MPPFFDVRTKPFSQITPATTLPSLTDSVVGVQSGVHDRLFTLNQLQEVLGGNLTVGQTPIAGGAANKFLYDGGGTLEEGTFGSGLTFSGGVLTAEGGGGGRSILTADTNYYVSATGSDSNPGTISAPWLTLQHAMSVISQTLDFAGFNVFVNIGAGNFVGIGIETTVGGGSLSFVGAGSGTTTILAGLNDGIINQGDCVDILFSASANIYFNKVTFLPAANFNAFLITGNGVTVLLGDVKNVAVTDIVFDCTNGPFVLIQISALSTLVDCNFLNSSATISIVGASQSIFAIFFNNLGIQQNLQHWSVTGTLTVTGAFCFLFGGGVYSRGSAQTFSGAGVVGQRFNLATNSAAIDIHGAGMMGANFFPGTTEGFCDSSSSYDGFPGTDLTYPQATTALRTVLTANTTFYVATTGSDSNDGSSGSPWATLQHAFDFIGANIDGAGFNPTIQMADGSYAGATVSAFAANTGRTYILGNASNNAAVTITGSGVAFDNATPGVAIFEHLSFDVTVTDTFAIGTESSVPTEVDAINCNFNSTATLTAVVDMVNGGQSHIINCTVTGSWYAFVWQEDSGCITELSGITFSGTPSFAGAVLLQDPGFQFNTITVDNQISGSATGVAYDIWNNLITNGTTIPGSSPGIAETGSNIDGFFAGAAISGLPVASDFAQKTYGIFEDTRDTTLAPILAANVGGTIEYPARIRLTGKTQLYVSTTGNDSNDGLTPATAWATLQHAALFIGSTLDLAGFEVDVNIGAGTFVGWGNPTYVGGGLIQFLGAGVASTTILSGPNDGVYNFGNCIDCSFALGGTIVSADALTFEPSRNFAAVNNAVTGNFFQIGNFLTSPVGLGYDTTNFPANLLASTLAGAVIVVAGPQTVTGNGTLQAVNLATGGPGSFLFDFGSWTISGNISVSSGFATAAISGVYEVLSTFTVTGSVTGPRFVAKAGGIIASNTPGSLGPNYLPGSTAGTVDLSSFYDGFQGPLPGINTQVTGYTFAIADAFERVEYNGTGAGIFTVPGNGTVGFPIGTKIWVTQTNTGNLSINGTGPVTLHNAGSLGGQWRSGVIYKRGTDEWVQTNV